MNSSSRFRNTRAALTAASSIGAKGIAGIIALASIRLTLRYLGPERFGLWMTIASLQAIFAFADFGLGNGVLNTVAEAYGRGDLQLASRAIRSAFALQAAVALLLLTLFWLASMYLDWPALLHVSGSRAAHEAQPAILIFASLFLARSVLQVVQQAQYGLQIGYVANAWTAIGNIAALIGLYLAALQHAGVPVLCLVVSGFPVASSTLNACWWLMTRLPPVNRGEPRLHMEWPLLRSMMKIGLLFFLLQVGAALYYGLDPIIVNQVLGPSAVATLAVVQKPFDMLSILILLMIQPLWPAYREAIVSGDIAWVRSTFRRALTISGAIAVSFALLMATDGRQLIRLWAGADVQPSEALILAYCAAHIFSAIQTPLSFFLNGLGKIRFQLLLSAPIIALSIAAKVLLTPSFGISAIPLITVALGSCLMLPVQIWYIRKQLRNIHQYKQGSCVTRHGATTA